MVIRSLAKKKQKNMAINFNYRVLGLFQFCEHLEKGHVSIDFNYFKNRDYDYDDSQCKENIINLLNEIILGFPIEPFDIHDNKTDIRLQIIFDVFCTTNKDMVQHGQSIYYDYLYDFERNEIVENCKNRNGEFCVPLNAFSSGEHYISYTENWNNEAVSNKWRKISSNLSSFRVCLIEFY
jgi:hypothetical protein